MKKKPPSPPLTSSRNPPTGTITTCRTISIGKSWNGKYRGQTQKWFALRFRGEESEINLSPPGHKQEFDQWRWARMDELPDLIVPFKRGVYEQVIAEFRHLGS